MHLSRKAIKVSTQYPLSHRRMEGVGRGEWYAFQYHTILGTCAVKVWSRKMLEGLMQEVKEGCA